MDLAELASRVMTLAQDGRADEAAQLGYEGVDLVGAEPPLEAAGLWYAIAVAEHGLGQTAQQVAAAERCLDVARAHGSPGWASNALSMRAMAFTRQDAVERAMTDLATAEAELEECADEALACWAHTGLGYCYDQLRLYELAEPHFVAALALEASPFPLPEAPVIDLLNLAELHLRWADELARVAPEHASRSDVEERHRQGLHWSRVALQAAEELGIPSYLDATRRLGLCLRAESEPAEVVDALRLALDDDGIDAAAGRAGGKAQVATALARAERGLGDLDGAVRTARLAVLAADGPGDWQVLAAARHLLVELEAEQGLPGAVSGREYGRLLSGVLWAQRLRTLQGARTARDVERLQRAREVAEQAAREDPLTGLGNRRALEEAVQRLTSAAATPGDRAGDVVQHSLLLFDVDDFKVVNDRYGHLVGDDVLRAIAGALSARARADDLLVRLGGDEFVVLAPGAGRAAAQDLGERMRAELDAVDWGAIAPGHELRVSVGVATTDERVTLRQLVGAADMAMYRAKAGAVTGPVSVPPPRRRHESPIGGSLSE